VEHGLYIANADGTAIRKLADCPFSTDLGWSVDGELMAFRADCWLALRDDKPHDRVGQGEDGQGYLSLDRVNARRGTLRALLPNAV
jgi:hypothetical protein